MKNYMLFLLLFVCSVGHSQEHFSGISTSSRVGIVNGVLNPAEFSNLSRKFEVNIYGISFDVANNKIGFSDLTSDTNFEELIFRGSEPVNMRINGQIIGPSFAMKFMKWGFGITTKANFKFDIVDVNPTIGNAIFDNNLPINITQLSTADNQRLAGVSYGEVGLSAARTVYENDKHRIDAGITLKLLFPVTYSNFGLSELDGTITQVGGDAFLTTNSPATLNIAYSGGLADSFTDFSDYTSSVFGNLNGLAADIGVTYQWKDGKSKYKIKGGASIRNIGSLNFKDSNNFSTNYTLNIPDSNPLNLSLFADIGNLRNVEDILISNGYLTQEPNQTSFRVNLPTMFALYGDFKIVPKVYVTGYLQQKMNQDSADDQITSLNIISITPRVNLGFFESFIPISNNDISGTNIGIGFRLGGFYLGSNSIFSALTSDSKQADFYTGFRFALL
jgi:hypothetical protein